MDTLVDHLFIFEGDGHIKDFNGTYYEYKEGLDAELKKGKAEIEKIDWKKDEVHESNAVKKKLSFKEKFEFENLAKEIEALEGEKAAIETFLASGSDDFEQLSEKSERIGFIIQELDEKELRWLELSEFI
jgi:ABC transport system ATP-binding/permease protein